MAVLAGNRAPAGPGAGRGRAPILAFVAVAAAVAGVRFAVLVAHGAPPGVDAGNWLAFGHALLGERIRPASVAYPPLVPLGLAAAVGAMGLTTGVAAFAAAASVAPAAALFAVLRSCGPGWPAALLAGLAAAATVSGEPAAWGGYPQLLGIAAGVLFVWQLDAALSGGPARGWGGAPRRAGLLLALTAACSHLVLAGMVPVAAALVAVRLAWSPAAPRASAGVLARAGAWAAGASLLLLPVYARVLASLGPSLANAGHGDGTGTGELLRRLDLLHADFQVLGRVLLLSAPLVLAVLWPRRASPLWAMSAAWLAGGLAVVVVTREPRFLSLLPPGAILAMGLWFAQVEAEAAPRVRRAATGLLAAALAVQVVTGTRAFVDQVRYYEVVDRELVAALEWVRRATPAEAVVVTAPVHDWPLGWWVEGVSRRRTLGASSLRWLNFADERRRARVANRVVGLAAPDPGVLDRARAAGAGYVLVAKAWPGFSGPGLDRVRGAVVYENGSAVVLATGLTGDRRPGG